MQSLLVISLSCGAGVGAQPVELKQDARPSRPVAGYLTAEERPDSRLLLPPPPAPGSADAARDGAAAHAALSLRESARWTVARQDADLALPHALDGFSCAMGVDLATLPAPKLTALLTGALRDIAHSTFAAKDKYARERPFMVDGGPICTPEIEDQLRKGGSYPSSHSAVGWGMALLLAEITPDKADAILTRGRAFGQSRVVCNVHWLSDVEEGRVMASATVARLHGNAQFRADMDAAREELKGIRSTAPAPRHDCTAEARALANG